MGAWRGTCVVTILAVASTLSCSAVRAAGAPKPSPTHVTRTASGDIPDTATYLRYKGGAYSIEYVEGWVQARLPGDAVRMSDIDSFERVTVTTPPRGTLAAFVHAPAVAETKREFTGVTRVSIKPLQLPAGRAMVLTFNARSAPDPVTGKRVLLHIDRYYSVGRKLLAVITLATPSGVDNVDAFRRIARSFKWTH